MDNDGIRERLEKVKEVKGITTNRLARESGVDSGNLSRGLSGKIAISRNVCEKIAKAWNVSVDWLINGMGDMCCGLSAEEKDTFLNQIEKERGINCSLDDYIEMKGELTALRTEVESLRNIIKKQDAEIDFYRSLLKGKE